ncbi:MAG: phospholipase A2 [Sphingomicrobium sp.]
MTVIEMHPIRRTSSRHPPARIHQRRRRRRAPWTGHFNEATPGIANGLNQLTAVGAKALTHDARGNVTAFGSDVFGFSSENLLTAGPGGATLSYDPLLRLYQTLAGGTTARFVYDGLAAIAENNASNAPRRRFVFGPGTDEPIVWYEGGGTASRRFLGADERGSIVSVTDSAGAVLGINRYDEFGVPQTTNLGRFGYTGQMWLPEIGEWYYKARVYAPQLGRFLQTDPIGYGGGINLYAYVGNDPVNFIDPLGLQDDGELITVCGGCNVFYYTPNTIAADAGLLTASALAPFTDPPDCRAPGADQDNCTVVVTGKGRSPPRPPLPPRTSLSIIFPAAVPDKQESGDYCSVVSDQPGGVDLSEACQRHDTCYATGTSRSTCDRALLNDIYKQCRYQGGDPYACAGLATLYYAGVRFAGSVWWRFSR